MITSATSQDFYTGTTATMSAWTDAIGFAHGTRIATPMGYVAVERLGVGDRVLTADGRHAGLVWVGQTEVPGQGDFAPVCFAVGAVQNMRPLRVAPGHRVQIAPGRPDASLTDQAGLVPAQSLVNGTSIVIDRGARTVLYSHLMLATPQVILAENVACETLLSQAMGERLLANMPVWSQAQDRVLLAA